MNTYRISNGLVAMSIVLGLAATSSAQGLSVGATGAATIEEDGTDTTVLFLERPTQTSAQMTLITSNNTWNVRAHGSGGKFRLDEANTAGTSFDLTPAGALELGAGVTANGNSTINGNLTVTGTFSNPSSRTLKTDIHAVDSRDMLRRVTALPVYSWRYKADLSGPEQIGPMAEDFQNAIGVGDGYYIAGASTAGVSLAAIRGLNEIVEDNGKELAQLRERNSDLAQRLAALEARLQSPQP